MQRTSLEDESVSRLSRDARGGPARDVVDLGPGPGEAAWRSDVALELWVDVERVPTVIRLAGTLDAATGANLIAVVEELMANGVRHFEVETATLALSDAGGAALLDDIRRIVESGGGCLQLDRWMAPGAGSEDAVGVP